MSHRQACRRALEYPPDGTPPEEEPPFWRRRWFLITAAVVVAILIYVLLSRPDDEDTAEASGSPSASASASVSQAASTQPSSAPAEPTAAPTSTPPPTPSPTPELAFEPIALSGTGDAIQQFTIPVDAPAIATIAHQGESDFVVITLADDGSENDLLVNTIGDYAGTVLFDAEGEQSVAFEVTADGAWTIDIQPVTDAQAWDPATPSRELGTTCSGGSAAIRADADHREPRGREQLRGHRPFAGRRRRARQRDR